VSFIYFGGIFLALDMQMYQFYTMLKRRFVNKVILRCKIGTCEKKKRGNAHIFIYAPTNKRRNIKAFEEMKNAKQYKPCLKSR